MISSLTIKSLKDVIDALGFVKDKFGKNDWVWWRGVENTNYSLQPSVYRNPEYKVLFENERLLYFRNRATVRSTNLPARDDFADWLFLMQHYGVPTRLMDWTESAFIATYFAVRNVKKRDENVAIYAISPSRLNQFSIQDRVIIAPRNEPAKSIILNAFDERARSYEMNVAVYPAHSDIRMLVQQSMFTLHGSPLPLDEDPNREDFLIKFEVEKKSANAIFEDLFISGFRDSNLFPDLQHLGNELRRQAKVVQFTDE